MNYLLAIGAIIAALAGLIFGVQHWEGTTADRARKACIGESASAALEQDQVQRQIEQERSAKQREVQNEQQRDFEKIVAQHATAAAAVRSLRDELAAERAKRPTSNDPAFIRERQAATALADVFGDCTEHYSGMAYQADLARNRGKSCEGKYDALQSPTGPTIRQQVEQMRKGKP